MLDSGSCNTFAVDNLDMVALEGSMGFVDTVASLFVECRFAENTVVAVPMIERTAVDLLAVVALFVERGRVAGHRFGMLLDALAAALLG